jgi:YidC/Oxa1 family membrane protein insertase
LLLPTTHRTPAGLVPQCRRHVGRVLIVAILALLAFAGAGCAPGTPFGPHIDVSGNAQTALSDGAKKVTAAAAAQKASQFNEATSLYNDAATYYSAVASKYTGTETGLQAVLAAGSIDENDIKADDGTRDEKALNAAHLLYRNGLSEYPDTAVSPALRQALIDANVRSVRELDELNSTKPGYRVMDFLVRILGNDPRVSPVVAIFLIAFTITVVLWPLRKQQYKQFKEMQRFQPELKKLQEKYKDDQIVFQEKFREFQKEHGYNPFAGCLPALIQLPVTLGMYRVILNYQYHFQPCTFLWINPANADMSAHWPGFLAGAIGHNLAELDLPLLVLYGASMFVSMKLNPAASGAPADPSQAETQRMMSTTMPFVLFFTMYQYKPASAFVLYWLISNILGMAQQWITYRTLPPTAPLITGGGGNVSVAGGGSGSGGGVMSASKSLNGTAPARPLTANPKLVSPKNRRKK